MLTSRGSHYANVNSLPDASLVIFIVAGATLQWWSFIWFTVFAFLIDSIAFNSLDIQGINFSFIYLMLIPAYLALWIGGFSARHLLNGTLLGYSKFFLASMAGTLVYELIASGSFYIWSENSDPTLGKFLSQELIYAPIIFASSAFWTVAFIATDKVYRIQKQLRPVNAFPLE